MPKEGRTTKRLADKAADEIAEIPDAGISRPKRTCSKGGGSMETTVVNVNKGKSPKVISPQKKKVRVAKRVARRIDFTDKSDGEQSSNNNAAPDKRVRSVIQKADSNGRANWGNLGQK